MEPGSEERSRETGPPLRDQALRVWEKPPAKRVYLRTVYPLNPGIPHFVDVPGGW